MSQKVAVTLVSTYGIPCGVAGYAEYLVENLKSVDPGLKVEVLTDLHPKAMLERADLPAVIILNYHAALHSQWHPEHIREMRRRGSKTVVIWHDSGVPNSDHCKAICAASDHFILHEPYDDLPEHGTYLRQGIPAPEDDFFFWTLQQQMHREGLWWRGQPIVGTVGLSMGYRNIDVLCQAAELAGWGVLVIASRATDEDVASWKGFCPATTVIREFIPKEQVVSYLSGCQATANLVLTNNAGTSGGVRQCIAARKPMIAFRSRQFRDIQDEGAICWLDDGSPEGVATALEHMGCAGHEPFSPMVRLAHRDSWTHQAKVYSSICRELLRKG